MSHREPLWPNRHLFQLLSLSSSLDHRRNGMRAKFVGVALRTELRCLGCRRKTLKKTRLTSTKATKNMERLLRDRPVNKQTWFVKALPSVSSEKVIKLRDNIAEVGYEQLVSIGAKGTSPNSARPSLARPEERSRPSNASPNQQDQSRFDVHV